MGRYIVCIVWGMIFTFIIGFIAMIGLRSTNLIPQAALPGLATASGLLTVTAMAALVGECRRLLAGNRAQA